MILVRASTHLPRSRVIPHRSLSSAVDAQRGSTHRGSLEARPTAIGGWRALQIADNRRKRATSSMTTTFAGLGLPADLVAALARQGITEPFPIQALTIADALAGRDSAARPRPARARPSPSASRSSAASARPSPATRAAWSSSRPASSPPRSPTRSGPLGEVRDRKVRAVYGGVSMDPQVTALQKGVDVVVGTPGPPHRPHRARRALRRARRGARRRRGRPHGRHGLHAPGPEDPLRHRVRRTRRCCSRPRSTAR